jgi:GWxTD domain-containing protein
LHQSAGIDSLRAAVELYEMPPQVEVEMQLLQFESDTAAGWLPYLRVPDRRLHERGVNFEQGEVLQSSRRTLNGADPEVGLVFDLPKLDPGNYRIMIVVKTLDTPEPETLSRQQRDLSIKGPNFPHLSTLDELIEPLVYIAFQGEYEHLNAAETEAEKRARFDAFWGTVIPNRPLARRVMRLYYNRVEEANALFSSYKEGWKTDRGMVYIVLGAPTYTQRWVNDREDTEIWFYESGQARVGAVGRSGDLRFFFLKPELNREPANFEHYILQRNSGYRAFWELALSRWRDGSVL